MFPCFDNVLYNMVSVTVKVLQLLWFVLLSQFLQNAHFENHSRGLLRATRAARRASYAQKESHLRKKMAPRFTGYLSAWTVFPGVLFCKLERRVDL